ncbi:hypothetical protein N7466_006387, partial [Penicillium verhagenii]|uniref:uncharacterized protein n=1 Tax=Penicillium verhagenii TaxID=1562060 RepID=UPI00254581A5
ILGREKAAKRDFPKAKLKQDSQLSATFLNASSQNSTKNGCAAQSTQSMSLQDLKLQGQDSQDSPLSTIHVEPKLLWDEAYDALKDDRRLLLEAYERILTIEIDEDPEADQNLIVPNNPEVRRYQMKQLVTKALKKTEKVARSNHGVRNAMKVALSANKMISSAVQVSPDASLAWAGVSLAIQMISNPVVATEKNRVGLDFVLRKMDWYWNLSGHILHQGNLKSDSYTGLRVELKNQLVNLYKTILIYQMMSVCSYYRSPSRSFLHNVIQLDDWDGSLTEVQDAERIVITNSKVYTDQQILEYHEQDSMTLKDIQVSMQNQALEQKDFHEKGANDQCLRDLRVTDPSVDIERIEHSKGSLLTESYAWILSHPHFIDWRNSHATRLLWIRGGPGKGKTMLMIGIAKELRSPEYAARSSLLSFFFCQETDANINNATAVLRGLIYQILCQAPSLMSHLREHYDKAGPKLFEGPNAYFSLRGIFLDMINDSRLENIYLMIDALDECQSGLNDLLRLIVESLLKSQAVKWIISSRHQSTIERVLSLDGKLELHLEKNVEGHVSRAVQAFIDHKMSFLTTRLRDSYDVEIEDPEIAEQLGAVLKEVSDTIHEKADDTFLWAALIFKQFEETECDANMVLDITRKMPSGLNEIYDKMMRQILESQSFDDCKKVLSVVLNSYVPLRLPELRNLAALRPLADIRRIIRLCYIIVLRGDEETVSFVHQSAKDYLIQHMKGDISSAIFPKGHHEGHQRIISRSLESMSEKLHMNIYELKHPGLSITELKAPPQDPLAAIRYSCVYWIDHLYETAEDYHTFLDDGVVSTFWKKFFLNWLEALSLMKRFSIAGSGVAKLVDLLQRGSESCKRLFIVKDARRFIMAHTPIVEKYPLQIYSSALLFSPSKSLTRELFRDQEPNWITQKPAVEQEWGSCLQILEQHDIHRPVSVSFSPDGKLIASISSNILTIWDAVGTRLQTFEGKDWQPLLSVTFTPDSTRVCASGGVHIMICDISGECLHIPTTGSGDYIYSTSLSPNGLSIVSGCMDQTVRIWSMATGACLKILKGHTDSVSSVQFSPDGTRIVSGSGDKSIKIWDTTGACLITFRDLGRSIRSVAFSPDGTKIVSCAYGSSKAMIWSTAGVCLQALQGHTDYLTSASFSPDGHYIVTSSSDKAIRIWDVKGACTRILEGHIEKVNAVCFSPGGTLIASGSEDRTLRVWDLTDNYLPILTRHSGRVDHVAISPNSTRIVSGSLDSTLKIWDVSGACLKTLQGHNSCICAVAISPDGTLIVSGSDDQTVRVWDFHGTCLKTLHGHQGAVYMVGFAEEGKRIVSRTLDGGYRKWDVSDYTCLEAEDPPSWVVVDGVLRSEREIVKIELSSPPGPTAVMAQGHRYGTDEVSSWITFNEQNVLLLPPGYRSPSGPYYSSRIARSETLLVLGCPSGNVLIFGFSNRSFPLRIESTADSVSLR